MKRSPCCTASARATKANPTPPPPKQSWEGRPQGPTLQRASQTLARLPPLPTHRKGFEAGLTLQRLSGGTAAVGGSGALAPALAPRGSTFLSHPEGGDAAGCTAAAAHLVLLELCKQAEQAVAGSRREYGSS